MYEIHEKLNHANHFNLLCFDSILLESGYIGQGRIEKDGAICTAKQQ
jgi:hypothetical protein